MRPPRFEEPTQTRTLGLIISISLILGILITGLFWLNVPTQMINPLFLFSLGAAGLSALFLLRTRSAPSRGLRLLAVLAAVSVVYLFPEMFRPGCGDTPRVDHFTSLVYLFHKNCEGKGNHHPPAAPLGCSPWLSPPAPERSASSSTRRGSCTAGACR